MKLFGKISNGYKKIASGIAIVAFLTMLYFALIPGGTMAGLSSVTALSGDPIVGAFVKIVEWPQYNATTDVNGNYTMPNVPYGEYGISAQAPGYTKNVSKVNVSSSAVTKDFSLYEGSVTGDYRYISMTDNSVTANKISSSLDVGKSFNIPQYGDHVAFDTEVYMTDVSGFGSRLTLNYFWANGTLAVTENPTVPPNGTYRWIPSDGTNGRPTSGKLVITSDNNTVGEFKIYSISNTDMIINKLYTNADGSISLSIPQYGDHVAFDTYLAISDVSGLGAYLTLKYYYSNGTLAVTENANVPSNGLYQDIAMSDGRNGRPTSGSLSITSDHNISGEYRIYSLGIGGLMSKKLYTDADKKTNFIVPQYGDHVAFDSFLAISDASGAGANLTIRFYYPNGTLAVTEKQVVPVNGQYLDLPMTDGRNGRPMTGKLDISSDNIILGEMRIYSLSGRGIMAESLFTQGDISNTLVVPYYGNNINILTYAILADVSGLGTNVRVDYHYLNGTLAYTENLPIPADGLYGYVASSGSGGKPTQGNMFITRIP